MFVYILRCSILSSNLAILTPHPRNSGFSPPCTLVFPGIFLIYLSHAFEASFATTLTHQIFMHISYVLPHLLLWLTSNNVLHLHCWDLSFIGNTIVIEVLFYSGICSFTSFRYADCLLHTPCTLSLVSKIGVLAFCSFPSILLEANQ